MTREKNPLAVKDAILEGVKAQMELATCVSGALGQLDRALEERVAKHPLLDRVIDFIYHTPHFESGRAYLSEESACVSDHLVVAARLRFC
jgi:hypothetical protein